jgi:hypothetical protein
MTAINANVSADQEWLPLSEDDSLSLVSGYYTIDSENVKVENGPHPASSVSNPIPKYNGRRAQRGVGGSTAASHTSGATLTRYYPEAPGGTGSGGVTVDNTVDPPAAVTTLVAPAAIVSGDTATFPLGLALIGPYTADFDADDLGDIGWIPLVQVPASTVVLRLIARVTEAWDVANAHLRLQIARDHDGNSDYRTLGQVPCFEVTSPVNTLDPSSEVWMEANYQNAAPGDGLAFTVAGAGPAGAWLGVFPHTDDTPTAGSADIYALIATPAA